MHRVLRSVVFASVSLVGCYAIHDRETDAATDARMTLDGSSPDAFTPDATTTTLDAGTDAFVPRDASCSAIEERNVRMCVLTPTGTIPEGEPYTLRIERTTCRCEERVCDVRVEGDRIALEITSCDTGMPCDECTNEAECVLPPLRSGTFQVSVDGVYAGLVDVEPRRMVSDARPACWAIPETPDAELECVGTPVDSPHLGEVCFRSLEDVGSFVRFLLTYDCTTCRDWSGGCVAIRESPRSILLRPSIQRCGCPDCPPCDPGACVARSVTCQTPPLRDGRYEVDVESSSGERRRLGAVDVLDVDTPGPVTCMALP